MTETKSNAGQLRISEAWDRYSLLESLIRRRFARAMALDGGPLTHSSEHQPQALTIEEEAALAFAACGITGPVLAELPFQSGEEPESGSGNIMTHLVGRTVASGDAVHSGIMFLINDEGAWMLKRPQDFPRGQIAELARSAREHEFVELYQQSRVRVADRRVDIPRELPFVSAFNKWSANLPGTSYFLPVGELSAFYINVLLTAFSHEVSISCWMTTITSSRLRLEGSPAPKGDISTRI